MFWIGLLIFDLPLHHVVKNEKWEIKVVDSKLLDPCALLQTLLSAPSLPGWCFLGHALQVTQKNQTGSASCSILLFVLRASQPQHDWVQAALSSPWPWGAGLDPGRPLGDWCWWGAPGNGLETETALQQWDSFQSTYNILSPASHNVIWTSSQKYMITQLLD